MTTADLLTGLYGSLAVTVVCLATAILLAHKHKTNAHIAGIGGFLVAFLITIYFAETVGARCDFEVWPKRIHMVFAFTSSFGTVVPLITGFLHWRGNKVKRETHKTISLVWFALVVLALGTGAWMLSASTLKPEFQASATK